VASNGKIYLKEEESGLQWYLNEIGKIPPLTRAEEALLAVQAGQGNQRAAEKLICANLLFVVKVAKEYTNRGLPLADLISEGNRGLIRAVKTFDPSKGSKLVTYAVWWIRQAILQAFFDNSRMIRLPQNHTVRMRRMIQTITKLEKELARAPALVEIAEALGDENDTFWSTQIYFQTPQSLDAPLDHDHAKHFSEFIPDSNESPPDAALQSESFQRELVDVFRVLDKREAKMLQLLFGLSNGQPLTLDKVGKLYKLSRERVRQIRNHALAKLRRSRRAKEALRDYLG
jgi:RNA polymerase primary sigma factor